MKTIKKIIIILLMLTLTTSNICHITYAATDLVLPENTSLKAVYARGTFLIDGVEVAPKSTIQLGDLSQSNSTIITSSNTDYGGGGDGMYNRRCFRTVNMIDIPAGTTSLDVDYYFENNYSSAQLCAVYVVISQKSDLTNIISETHNGEYSEKIPSKSTSSGTVKATIPKAGSYYIYIHVQNGARGRTGAIYINNVTLKNAIPTTSITTQPTNKTANIGENVTFSIETENAKSFQWYKNGTAVENQTNSTYSFIATETDHNAEIYCIVQGTNGPLTSNKVKCTINAPSITVQPTSKTINKAEYTTFSVTATNVTKYQWYKDKTEITGATSSSYRTIADETTHNAEYYCKLSGPGGTIDTNTVKLKIAEPTSSAALPKDIELYEDATAVFSATNTNAASTIWQYSDDNGITYYDIEGETDNTLTITNVTVKETGIKYRQKVIGYSGTSYSRVATLTVNRAPVTFVTELKENTSAIEGQNITLIAVGNAATKTYKWSYKPEGSETFISLSDSTGEISSSTYYISGSSTSTLKIDNIKKSSFDNAIIRCTAINVDKSATTETIMKVADPSITGFTAEFSHTNVSYGSTIDINDVYVFLKYDSGNASFGKNFTGLTFADGSTKQKVTDIGVQTYNVKLVLNGKTYTSSISVESYDTTPPTINNITAIWKETNEELTDKNISTSTDNKIIISATAADNYDDASALAYKWYKNGVVLSPTTNNIEINENAIYKVEVSDTKGNTSEKTIDIKAYDTEPPKISLDVTPTDKWSTYRMVSIIGSDDTGLAEYAYSDNGQNWTKSSSRFITENGNYTFYVKDKIGNISKGNVDIAGIDKDKPIIDSTTRKDNKELQKVTMTIEGHDNTSNIIYGYQKGTETEWNESGIFIINRDDAMDINGRSFSIKDEAGNITTIVLYFSSRYVDSDEVQDMLDKSVEIKSESTKWVNAETGVTLNCNLTEEQISNYKLYPCYTWNYDNKENVKSDITVHSNGEYYVMMYSKLNNGEKDTQSLTKSKSISINNIDSQKPETNESDITQNKYNIHVNAKDTQSGIYSISITGGEYKTKNIVYEGNTYPNEKEIDIPIKNNTDYVIEIIDRVGNVNQITKTTTGIPITRPQTMEIKLIPKNW